jgi:hypothetical protein
LPLAVSAPVDWLPEVALVPDQPLEAVQVVALVEDQVSVEAAPLATEVGFAASDRVGAGGGVGLPPPGAGGEPVEGEADEGEADEGEADEGEAAPPAESAAPPPHAQSARARSEASERFLIAVRFIICWGR